MEVVDDDRRYRVLDGVHYSSCASGEDRSATGGGLEGDEPVSFRVGWDDDNIGAAHRAYELGPAHRSGEVHVTVEAEVTHLLAKVRVIAVEAAGGSPGDDEEIGRASWREKRWITEEQ